jgi:hypothetical protein
MKEEDKWAFAFAGVGIDAFAVGESMGIDKG